MFTEKLIKLFTRYITEAQFVFRFMYYEKNTTINDTNVVQYEFINQGNTVIDINGMLLQPSASGLEPVRWIGAIQNNENDVTVYKVKFQKVATKLCSGSVCITGFVPCLPPANCPYSIKIEIDGVSLGGGFLVNCTMSQAEIQALLDANLLPQYVGKILVTFDVNGLCFQFTDISVPTGDAGQVTIFFQATDPVHCPLFSPIVFLLTCSVFTARPKLLVISKMKASTRVLN